MSLELRAATVADVQAIQSLFAPGDREGAASTGRLRGYIAGEYHPQLALPPRIVVIASKGATTAGYCAGHCTRRFDCTGELQWLFVSPAFRRQGVGAALIGKLAGWFVARKAMRVCVNVDPSNAPALWFFGAMGASAKDEHWLEWLDIGQQ